jgi:hypothetical protein
MVYIIGILDEDYEIELRARGHEVEPAPRSLVPEEERVIDGDGTCVGDKYRMIWIDASFEDMFDAPEIHAEQAKPGEKIAAAIEFHEERRQLE